MTTSDILLLGASGSGKTKFINAVTGSDFVIGEFGTGTSKVQSSNFVDYVLFDTPGFDNDANGVSAQIPGELFKLVLDWRRAKDSGNSNCRRLRAIIYFHDLNEYRIIPSQLSNIKIMKKISEVTGVNTIFVVTTKWDSGTVTEEQRNKREKDLTKMIEDYLQPNVPLQRCRNDKEHAIEVMQDIISMIPPMSYPSPAPHLPSPAVSPSQEKSGFLRRIWRGVVKKH